MSADPVPTIPPGSEYPDSFEECNSRDWTVAELRALARLYNIDLRGAKRKADICAVLMERLEGPKIDTIETVVTENQPLVENMADMIRNEISQIGEENAEAAVEMIEKSIFSCEDLCFNVSFDETKRDHIRNVVRLHDNGDERIKERAKRWNLGRVAATGEVFIRGFVDCTYRCFAVTSSGLFDALIESVQKFHKDQCDYLYAFSIDNDDNRERLETQIDAAQYSFNRIVEEIHKECPVISKESATSILSGIWRRVSSRRVEGLLLLTSLFGRFALERYTGRISPQTLHNTLDSLGFDSRADWDYYEMGASLEEDGYIMTGTKPQTGILAMMIHGIATASGHAQSLFKWIDTCIHKKLIYGSVSAILNVLGYGSSTTTGIVLAYVISTSIMYVAVPAVTASLQSFLKQMTTMRTSPRKYSELSRILHNNWSKYKEAIEHLDPCEKILKKDKKRKRDNSKQESSR